MLDARFVNPTPHLAPDTSCLTDVSAIEIGQHSFLDELKLYERIVISDDIVDVARLFFSAPRSFFKKDKAVSPASGFPEIRALS